MNVTLKKVTYEGVLSAPPSKSAAHRRLICAGLAEGQSRLFPVADSEDMLATLDCLAALGVSFSKEGEAVVLDGCSPLQRKEAVFPCRESGSTLRFFLPLALLSDKPAVFRGSKTLMKRPLDVYEHICIEQGLDFMLDEEELRVCGPLKSGHFRIDGSVSSQFVSGLLFALPLLEGYSILELTPPVVSAPYIAMTVEAMNAFGVKIESLDENRLLIPGGQHYTPAALTVEGDWSNAAFFLALNLLGSDIEVTGLNKNSLQGDRVVRRMLGKLERGCPTLDIADCPDLAPILMAVGAALNGVRLTNTDRLKDKESNRSEAMAEELGKLGVTVVFGENELTVLPPKELLPPKTALQGHNDHRIVMACAVLLTLVGGTVEGAEAVSKSFPDFFEKLNSLTAIPREDEKEPRYDTR